jgi:hypothetical protein
MGVSPPHGRRGFWPSPIGAVAKQAGELADRYKVFVVPLQLPDSVRAIRVTPSVYTTLESLMCPSNASPIS